MCAVAWNAPVLASLRPIFPKSTVFIRDVFDVVFISRRNLDLAGDRGLYTLHYDGNVRIREQASAPYAAIVLVRPIGDVRRRLLGCELHHVAGTAVGLDFNNELHFVDVPATVAAPRLALKSGMHVVKPGTPRMVLLAYVAAHRLVFFVVKTVMETTKGSKTLWHRVVGLVFNNGFRVLNNVHAALPVLFAGPPAIVVLLAPFLFPLHFLSYLVNIYAVCVRGMSSMTAAAISLSLRTMGQLVLLRRLRPRQWAWGLLRGKLGAVFLIGGVLLHARVFSVLGLKGTYYAPELEGWYMELETAWPYDGSISHPMHAAMTLQAIGVGLFCSRRWLMVLGLHVAWTLVVAFFEENAGVAHELLLAPLTHVS